MIHAKILPKMKSVILTMLFFLMATWSAFAQNTYTWNGSASTAWATPANWDRTPAINDHTTVPTSSDLVMITAGMPRYPQLSANVSIANLIIKNGASIDLNNRVLTVTGSALSQIGDATLSTPSAANIATVAGGGTLGTLTFSLGRLEMYFTTVTGNIAINGDLLIRRNEFKGTAALTQSQVFTSRTNGANIFTGLATISQTGSGSWIWGNSAAALGAFTGADTFKGGLTASINTSTTSELRFADNTLGNTFIGTTNMTSQGVATLYVAPVSGSSATFSGATTLTNSSTNTNGVGLNFASAGTVTFGNTLGLTFTSTTSATMSTRIGADSDLGKVTLNGNVTITNATPLDRRVYIGTNSASAQSVSVASGVSIAVNGNNSTNFANGLISLSKLSFAGATNQQFTLSNRAGIELNYCVFPAAVTINNNVAGSGVGEIDLNYNTFVGTTTFTLNRTTTASTSPTAYAQLNSRVSGNTFTGNSTLVNGGDSNWLFGFVSADLFSGTLSATCNTPTSTSSDPQGRYIMFAKGSTGTTFVGAATFNASLAGTIITTYDNNSTATFQGTLAVNNATNVPYRTVSFGGEGGVNSNVSLQNTVTVTKTGNQSIKWGSDFAKVVFSGANSHNFSTNDANENIFQLEINKTASSIVSLANSGTGNTISISDNLILTSGYLNVGTAKLNLGTSIVSGGSSASHIQSLPANTGVLMITVTSGSPTIFPVGQGSSTTYQPVTLTQNSGSDKAIQVRLGTEATANSVNRNWIITQPTASNLANVDIVTQWAAGTESSGTVRPNADILQVQANGSYSNLNVSASLTGSDPYTLTKTSIPVISTTNIGTFAVSSTIRAYAGADFSAGTCAMPVFLSANTVAGQTGTWSRTSGGGSVTFSDVNNPNSTVSLPAGTHVLRWSFTTAIFDEVTLTVSTSASVGGPVQTWTGNTSTDWNDCGNWSGSPDGVPASTTDVIIPAGMPRYPILTGAVSCKDLMINGGNINISNQTLTSTGNVTFSTAFITSNGGSVFATALSSVNTFYTGAGAITLRNGNTNSNSGLNTFQIPVTLASNGVGNFIWGAYDDDYGTGGADIFNRTLTLSNASTGRIYVSYNTSGNIFNDNITLTNSSTGSVGISSSSTNISGLPDPTYPNASGTSFLTAGKTITGSNSGSGLAEVVNVTQASGVTTHSHSLSFPNAHHVTMLRNTLFGNTTVNGANLTIQNNVFGSIPATNTVTMTSFTTSTVYCGGNTVNAVATLNLNTSGTLGSGTWSWGYSGGGDKFKGTLTANNNSTNNGTMNFADQTTGNTFEGNTTFNMGTAATSRGTIGVANNFGAVANFIGSANTIQFTNSRGVDPASSFFIATEGDITFDGTARFTLANNGHASSSMYIAADSGTVVFNGNVVVEDLKAFTMGVNQVMAFGNNGFYGGRLYVDLPNQITLASGKTITVSGNDFRGGDLQINNFTQYGTSTPQTLTLANRGSLRIQKSIFNSNFTASGASINSISNTFAGNLDLTMNNGGGNSSGGTSGGNTVTGNTTLTASATAVSGDWIWGAGYDPFTSVLGVDNFNGNLTINNPSTAVDFISVGTVNVSALGTYNGGANVLGNTILNSSANGRINLAPVTNTTFNFSGNLTATAGTTSFVNMGASGKLVAKGSSNTTFTETGTLANVTIGNMEMDKPSSAILSLGSNVVISNSLNFVTGRFNLLTFNLDLGTSTLSGEGQYNNVIGVNSTGTLTRQVAGTATVFPLATTTNYLPMTLTNTGTSDKYNARLRYDINDRYNVPAFTNLGNNIDAYYIKPIWVVSENVAGGSNLVMGLQWDSSTDEQTSFNRNLSVIKNYNTGANQWDCKSSEAAASLVAGTYYSQQSSAFTTANLNTAFSVGTLVADGGSDFNVAGCNIFPLTAKVPNGTGPGIWTRVSGPNTPTITTSTVMGAVTVSNAITGTYVFKWETGSAAACTLKSDFVTVNFSGTGGPGVSPVTARWNGLANNSNWFDCGNWENSQMPGANTDVTIPFLTASAATVKYPIVTNPVVIGGLFMSAHSQLTINNGQNFTMTGENVSLTFATITGSTSGANTASLIHDVATTTSMTIANMSFPSQPIRIFSPRLTVARSTFGSTTTIEKTRGIADDDWDGGNIFSGTTTIVNRANDVALAKLNLAFVTGDIFVAPVTFNIADVDNADIIPANNGTTEFRQGFTAVSLRDADFTLGTNANGKVAFTNTTNQTVTNSLLPNRNIVYRDLTINQGSATTDLTVQRTSQVMDQLTMTRGRVLLGNGVVFSLENNVPASLTMSATPSNSFFQVGTAAGTTGVFGRQINNTGANYLFPVGFTSAYRPIDIAIANTDPAEKFFVRVLNQVNAAYDNSNALTMATVYNSEFISTAWVVTHANSANVFSNVAVKPYWTTIDETNVTGFPVKFERTRSFVTQYDYNTNKFKCVSQFGNVDGGVGTGASPYFKTTTANIADGVAGSTNFGIFSVASATATASATLRSQTNACLIIDLNATAGLESPPGGQWEIVGGFFTASGTPISFTTGGAGARDGTSMANAAPWPVIASVTSAATVATNILISGSYQFSWKRFSTECGGSLTSPIDTEVSSFVTVTSGGSTITKAQVWNGAIDTNWASCYNWSNWSPDNDGTYDVTINAGATFYPVLPSDFALRSLTINAGGKIDLNGKVLTAQTINFNSALITDTGNPTTPDGVVDGIYNGFITATVSATIRKTQFDGVFGIEYSGGTATNNGGNRFMSATTIRHIGGSDWKWGWNDISNRGGADVFESDLDVLTQDCGPYNFFRFVPRIGGFNGYNPGTGATNLATNLPDLGWIQEPFYNPGTAPANATATGNSTGFLKNLFPNYYRKDNYPTNTSNPVTDSTNAVLNKTNAALNRADELQSLANVVTGNANAAAAYIDADAARLLINNVSQTALNHLTNGTILNFLTGATGVSAALTSALNTAYTNLDNNRRLGASASCYTGGTNTQSTITTATTDVRNAYLSSTNPPGTGTLGGMKGDNKLANDARIAANAANACANTTTPLIQALITAINNSINAYNANYLATFDQTINLSNTASRLTFAYNTQGTEFKGNTNFTVRNCGELRISEGGALGTATVALPATTNNVNSTPANAKFTGAGKAINFINESYANYDPYNNNSNSPYAIWTSINSRTNMSFEGVGATVHFQNRERGGVRINESGTVDFKNGTNMVFSNFVSANQMWIGGNGNGTSWANLDNGFLSVGTFNRGDVVLRNFRQFGSGFPTNINVDRVARLQITGLSQFDGNMTITGTRTGNSSYGNDGNFVYIANNTAEQTIFNGAFNLLNTSTISTGAYIGNRGNVFFNGNVQVSNASAQTVGYYFGATLYPTPAVPTSANNYGSVTLADLQTFKIGKAGFPGGGWMALDNFNQKGNTRQNISLPVYAYPYDYNNSSAFVTCAPNKAGFQPCTPGANMQLFVRRSSFDAGVRLEAPDMFLRNSTYKDTVYAVVYNVASRNFCCGGMAFNDGESSGGNTFNKKASFEFRGNNGGKWFFGGKNYVSGSIQSASSFVSEPDVFKDTLFLYNNGNNTEMAIGYNSTGNVFDGDVIIRNRGRVNSDFVASTPAPLPSVAQNLSNGSTAPVFRIGGDPTTYTPVNSLFPVSKTQGSTLVFNKSLTIMNESTQDVMIAAHPLDNITIKGDLIISNKKAPYYTGVDICGVNNYRGDVRFISGTTTIASTSNITINEFPDGELEFTSVILQGAATDLVNIDLSSKVTGDRGRARITLQKSTFQRRMNIRSPWINFFGSTYETDASFERTSGCFFTAMGSVNMEGRSGNLYKGTFSLTEGSNSNTTIRLATNGNIANVFSGDIYQKTANFVVKPNLTKSIYPAYNYVSQFAGDVNLNFATVAELNFTSTSGMEFNGVGNQALNSNTKVVMSKVLVNQSKGSTITPNQSFDVNSQLFFNYGKILLGANLATIKNINDVISVSVQYPNEGHIVANQSGTVNRIVNPSVDNITFITVLFPIGNLTNYLPVTLAQKQTGTSDQFRARLLDDVYTTYNISNNYAPSDDPAFDPIGSPTAIDRNFVKRSWIVTEDVTGGTDGAIMIQWFEGGGGIASDEPIGFDRQKTTVVHYNSYSNQWRCMDAVGPVSGPPNIRRGSYSLLTDNSGGAVIDNYKRKMGVFSIGSFTAGEGGNIQTCGAGSAQLSAPVLTPPLYGQWSFVNFASITPTFVTSDIPLTVIAAPAGFSFSSINDATALAQGLDANTAYRLRWTALGLDGCNASYADYIVITGAFSNAITNKTLVWQGVDAWFWYCQNWKVQGENYFALPDVTMDLRVPDVTVTGTGTYNPVLYDRNVTVKSLTLESNSSFTLFQTANTPIQFTMSNFMTVQANALYNNTQVTTINGNTENAGEIRSFLTAITGATQPILEFKGNLKNTGIFNQNDNVTRMYKDLENSGTGVIFHTAGKVEFLGTTNQFITGGNDVKLFNVDLNKTVASNDNLTIASTKLFINPNGSLKFLSGNISSYSLPSWYGGNSIYTTSPYAPSSLVFASGATHSFSDAYKYVTGPVSKIGNEDFEFPLGKGGYWARLALSDMQGATPTDQFTAEYFNFRYSNIITFKAVPTVAPKLTRVSYVEHWQLNRDVGTTTPKVTLFWENGSRSGVGNLAKLYVAHFDNTSQWDNMGGNVSGGSTTAKGSVTSTANFLNFSPPTLGTNDTTNNPLPVEWLYVRAKLVKDEEAALVEWATIFEANTDYFEVQKSLDGQIFKAIGIQKAAKNASNVSNYNFLDNNPYSGISYYRIRQVDADGQETFSRTVSVSRSKTAKQSFYVFPSPTVSSNVNLLINSNTDGELTLILNNTLGAIMYSAKIKVEKGENRIALSDLNLPNGVYFARLAEFGLISKFEIQQ